MQDPERAAYVTHHYLHLQGLKWALVGVFYLALEALNAGWLGPRPDPWRILAVGALVGLLYWLVDRYYKRAHGRVAPPPNGRPAGSAGTAALVALILAAAVVDLAARPPFSAPGLVIAGLVAERWWEGRRFQRHYLLLAALVAALSLSPLLVDGGWRDEVLRYVNIGTALLFIVGGLLDHLLLARTLRFALEGER
jgi:hypothetical protein